MNMVSMIYVFVLIVEIVNHTPLEQQVVELFEKRGAWQKPRPPWVFCYSHRIADAYAVSIVR